MRSLRLALALLVLLPAFGVAQQQAAADQKVSVVVFPFSAFMIGGDGNALAEALRGMILTEVANHQRLQTFERQRVDQLFDQRKQSMAGRFTDDDAVAVGQLLGASYAFTGGITFDSREGRLDLRVLNTETGQVMQTFKEKAPRDDFLKLAVRIGQQLAALKPLPPRKADVAIPVKAAFAFSRGLDYEKRGEKTKAAAMFRAALDAHPDYAQARAALGRVN